MTRLLSAAVLIAIILATLWLAPAWATVALAAAAAAGAAVELALLARATGAGVSPVFLAGAAAVVCVAFAMDAMPGSQTGEVLILVLLAGVVGAGMMTLATGAPAPATIARAGVAFMAPLYVGLPLGALAAVRVRSGTEPVLLLLLMVAVSDSAQYYTGRLLGRHKLAPP